MLVRYGRLVCLFSVNVEMWCHGLRAIIFFGWLFEIYKKVGLNKYCDPPYFGNKNVGTHTTDTPYPLNSLELFLNQSF